MAMMIMTIHVSNAVACSFFITKDCFCSILVPTKVGVDLNQHCPNSEPLMATHLPATAPVTQLCGLPGSAYPTTRHGGRRLEEEEEAWRPQQ